ncbi:T9SS type A sorting domain-containing protein [Membranicola marinus]|uniref:T9SS type A sorting domain-containing protein n=1 Tax=Membranihabitans marinus TaxID=1227546 RepID=A0A953HXC6_9BACT|nr:T9SS type A sorting domain-containing protein [Membranihabitans marinus]MBY5957482.1 T9SS type A sorting domain-containing protein [Membranihabitans marinus]
MRTKITIHQPLKVIPIPIPIFSYMKDTYSDICFIIFAFVFSLLSNFSIAQPIGVDTVTIAPRLVFQGEHFNGAKGVEGLMLNIENKSIGSAYLNINSEYSGCDYGIAEMDIAYHYQMGENNFDLYVAAPSNGQGMSVADIINIQRFINKTLTFDNYEFVAADANNNGVVDTNDVNMWQQANLNPTLWPSGGYWMVIQNTDKGNFEATSQSSVLYNYSHGPGDLISVYGNPSDSGTVNNLFSFRVIKKGDVNASNCYYCWNFCSPPALLNTEEIYVDLVDKEISKVRLNINNPNGLAGMQWFLGYDENEIKIVNVRSDIPGLSKKDYRIGNGEFRMMHVASEPGEKRSVNKQSFIELSIVPRNTVTFFKQSQLHTTSIEIVDGDYRNVSDVSVEVSGSDRFDNTLVQTNQFYPNPVNNRLNTTVISDQNQAVDIQLIDVQGRVIHSNTWMMVKGINRHYVEFTDYPSGVYFLQGWGDKGLSFHRKIVK